MELRLIAMDFFTACIMAGSDSLLNIFYGGARHTQNVAAALKNLDGFHSVSSANENTFFVEVLRRETTEFVFLGEHHSRTSRRTIEELLSVLHYRCHMTNMKHCTFFIERHRPLSTESPVSKPNEVACNAQDSLAIQQFRCNTMIETNTCPNVKVEFVDVRHVSMGFFREEISEACTDPSYRQAFHEFQRLSLDALIYAMQTQKSRYSQNCDTHNDGGHHGIVVDVY